MFDVPFNPVTPIPALEHEGYVGERFLDFDKIALLLKTTEKEFFNPDVAVLIQLVFFCGGQRPYEIMSLAKNNFDKKSRTLSIPPSISKTKKRYYLPLCDSAVHLIDLMISRYADNEYPFPNQDYETKLRKWGEKNKNKINW